MVPSTSLQPQKQTKKSYIIFVIRFHLWSFFSLIQNILHENSYTYQKRTSCLHPKKKRGHILLCFGQWRIWDAASK